MKEFPRKFLSLRDKNHSHNRSKSAPPSKSRPRSTEAFFALFGRDAKSKDTADKDEEDFKVEEIRRHLDELNITNVSNEHIKDILGTAFVNGGAKQTAEFISIEQKSVAGTIVPYNRHVQMLGAENRGGVTCYLDALLFSMFCKMDAFECMLKTEFPAGDTKAKLVNLLRVWVNLLRSGKLVKVDLTRLIQEAMGDSGWPDARLLEQQDTSEAFAFLTETLQLPLLSLQVDLFHQGRKDKEDHKVVYERLLNLAVPPNQDGKSIRLEDCLEEYFNAQVDVLRDSEEAKKSSSNDKEPHTPTLLHQKTLRLVRGEEYNDDSTTFSASPLDMSPLHPFSSQSSVASDFPALERPATSTGVSLDATPKFEAPAIPKRLSLRNRSGSLIRRVVIDEEGRPTDTNVEEARKISRKGSMVVKAVTIPAWQFFRLIPWHAVRANEPRSNSEVVLNFEQRPVVGICLKRYAMTSTGQPQRHNTYIDIPDSLRLPHFMLADGPNTNPDDSLLTSDFKLVLQSVICHRGDTLQSGHYIAFARAAPKLLTSNRRHSFDPPPDYEEAQWVKFDDLEEPRVTVVDNIKKSLAEEMPYLLFYQIVPMVEVACPSTDGTATGPPSYQESKTSLEIQTSRATDGGPSIPSKPPSIRLSMDDERPTGTVRSARPSVSGSVPTDSRRDSANFTLSSITTPIITPTRTPEANSPIISPSDIKTPRLSRAASRFTLGRQSRPSSQSGEGRISLSITRLGGLIKQNREVLPNAENGEERGSTPLGSPSPRNASFEVFRSAEGQQPPSTANTSTAATATTAVEPESKRSKQRRKSKSREKTPKPSKQKDSSQPDRECLLM
ncbi:ubiquitin hydrolase family protein [Cordyceps fumosorosea ARSEF 2679]|uniref:ubiquitinyl hydrolase 1 n=1 Tax=Cordyceps fumosorosea (strain ARSEF 2679) TaxID=1081104 RepID=A0A167MCY2_CORFA|nr:ubiquitin hydrolase family protein [Cordyceps fumosorosea ARSEF 2679]OAA54214.1 ubiquitin hydrolase family protein [Cordyceps fumosorosea ARSEF 2679]